MLENHYYAIVYQNNRGMLHLSTEVRREIKGLTIKRDAYILNEKKKRVSGTIENTLESEIEKIIRRQASKYQLHIE